MPGVARVKADARKGRVEIAYEAGRTTVEALRNELNEMGFPVVS